MKYENKISKILKKYKIIFDSLAYHIRCPACEKFVSPPFYNLGPKYNSFEGCKDCYEQNTRD